MEILAIADDLTGALEAGAKFAAAGLESIVATAPLAGNSAAVVVIDTESRHLSPAEAAMAVKRCHQPAKLIYKKTDSTLRGNIAAEFRALADIYPEFRIAYVPAYPSLGRTVRGGRLFVHGKPLEETHFAEDQLNPVCDGSVRAAVGDCECVIFDGETEDDVDVAAGVILSDPSLRIVAGPAAIGAALASRLRGTAKDPPLFPPVATCLVVNGSRSVVSIRQIEYALTHKCISKEAGAPWRLLQPEIPIWSCTPAEIARRTAAMLLDELGSFALCAILVIGGDTSFGFLEAIGRPLLRPLGEIVPGVPVSRIDGRSTILISKAGGFGDDDVLCRVKDRLSRPIL